MRHVAGAWAEIELPPEIDEHGFLSVYPVADGYSWFRGRYGIYTWHAGIWEKQLNNNPSEGEEMDLAVSNSGVAFVLHTQRPSGNRAFVKPVGWGWHTEELRPENGYFDFKSNLYPDVTPQSDLFFASRLDVPGPEVYYAGVIKRAGSPSATGRYEVIFAAPHSSYVYQLDALAMADERNGRAVGERTSVVCIDGEWYVEDLGALSEVVFQYISYGPGGYWAVGQEYPGGPWALYNCEE